LGAAGGGRGTLLTTRTSEFGKATLVLQREPLFQNRAADDGCCAVGRGDRAPCVDRVGTIANGRNASEHEGAERCGAALLSQPGANGIGQSVDHDARLAMQPG